jgi:hypothetical protein
VAEDVDFLESHPDVGLVYTDFVQVDSEGHELHRHRANGPSGRVTGELLLRNFVSIGTHLVRTSLVRQIGGFLEERQLSGCEDWEMWVRLSMITDFAYNPVVTAKIRTHPGNTMTNAAAMGRAIARAAEIFQNSEELSYRHKHELKRMNANVAVINAINYCSQNDKSRSIGFLREAFSANPMIVLDRRYAYTVVRVLSRVITG